MSTRYIISGAGAVAGAFIAGPQGALYGWQLGSMVGNVIDPQVVKGPSIGDIAQQTSQEGVPIPIVYGLSPPMAGNIIATAPPKITKKKSGGKGGPKVESEVIKRTYAIAFCEGPVDGFVRVWRNNTKVYDALDPEFTEPGSGSFGVVESRNEAFLEKARFFLGTYDQEPSPDLEVTFGVGTTPAHRGIVYMVMNKEDLTREGGAIPYWQAQVGTPPVVPMYLSAWSWTGGTLPSVAPGNFTVSFDGIAEPNRTVTAVAIAAQLWGYQAGGVYGSISNEDFGGAQIVVVNWDNPFGARNVRFHILDTVPWEKEDFESITIGSQTRLTANATFLAQEVL